MRKKLKWISLLTLLIVSLAIVPARAQTHTLAVQSSPFTGVDLTINSTIKDVNITATTNWSGDLEEANYTIVAPSAWVTLTNEVYDFEKWEDDSTEPTRLVYLNETMTLIAYYTRATFTVTSDPEGVEFTIEEASTHTTPWTIDAIYETYTITMPLWATFNERLWIFDEWEDGSTIDPTDHSNLTRTITVEASTTVTAFYGFAYNITTIHPPIVYIDPPLIEEPDATQVTVDIVVSPSIEEVAWYSMRTHTVKKIDRTTIPMEDLWGAAFSVHYNPEVVHGAMSDDDPPEPIKSVNLLFLGSGGGTTHEIYGAGFDDEAGELRLFGMFIEETLPEEDPELFPEVEEDTVLATVTFNVVGDGVTCFSLGDDTELKDGWGEDFERELHYGIFRNANATLFMGPAKGGKIWPAWKHGSYAEPQILYGRFTNLGDGGVLARIRFTVSSAVVTESVVSNEVWAEPGETIVVSAIYEPPATGDYTVRGEIEFKYDGCLRIDYSEMQPELGGDSATRDIGTKFWVK